MHSDATFRLLNWDQLIKQHVKHLFIDTSVICRLTVYTKFPPTELAFTWTRGYRILSSEKIRIKTRTAVSLDAET